ncbi:MAG TPA: flagellar motor protein MotB [Candidatus Hydrogenedentes bacterium]|nr:flagellar motor protein MotB [Candidatus Hydrogenedentota bacterium]HOS04320.1 flagellar motor protein MotB [Candidatus Hydrogenedentota bacterium]
MERKRRHDEEHENEERWLLTYADLITLLMVFFIVMYAMSKVDASKMQQLIFTMRTAFKNLPTSPVAGSGMGIQTGNSVAVMQRTQRSSSPPLPLEAAQASQSAKKKAESLHSRGMTSIKEKIEGLVQEKGLGQNVAVTVGAGGNSLVVRLADSLLFESGNASLSPQAAPLLDSVGMILAQTGKYVRVEGHTDDVPVRSGRYETNWQLSTERATNVVMYLIAHYQILPELLSASGYGEYRPLVRNESPETRARNRRVEFVILDQAD